MQYTVTIEANLGEQAEGFNAGQPKMQQVYEQILTDLDITAVVSFLNSGDSKIVALPTEEDFKGLDMALPEEAKNG